MRIDISTDSDDDNDKVNLLFVFRHKIIATYTSSGSFKMS